MARCWTGPPKVPTFPLLCNIIKDGAGNPPSMLHPITQANVPCSLTLGDRVSVALTPEFVFILFAKLTDVRGLVGFNPSDTIECPAGTLRYYQVTYVDDVGKGFANEYRQCYCRMISTPYPIP